MNVAVIGAGRLGSVVARGLAAAGHTVGLVRRGEPIAQADIYWLTVRDAQIGEVARSLPAGGVRLHSAGALGPEALGTQGERGVLHPLMSFRAGGDAPAEPVHARIAGTPGAVAAAQRICDALGWKPFFYEGDPVRYHAAACIASGQLAALFLDAADLLVQGGMTPSEARARLLALSVESLRNVAMQGESALTGPAVRNDVAIIDAHRAILGPEQLPAYNLLTERIRARRK